MCNLLLLSPKPATDVVILSQLLFTVTSSLCIVCCFLGSGQLAAALKPSDIERGTKVRTLAPTLTECVAGEVRLTITESSSSSLSSSTLPAPSPSSAASP